MALLWLGLITVYQIMIVVLDMHEIKIKLLAGMSTSKHLSVMDSALHSVIYPSQHPPQFSYTLEKSVAGGPFLIRLHPLQILLVKIDL
jgi:hypothetical protein